MPTNARTIRKNNGATIRSTPLRVNVTMVMPLRRESRSVCVDMRHAV